MKTIAYNVDEEDGNPEMLHATGCILDRLKEWEFCVRTQDCFQGLIEKI